MLELDPDDPRAVWLLDVDGVLNTSRNAWSEAPYHADVVYRRMQATFRLHWSPSLLRTVHRVRDEGLVELVWCTTWCAESDSLDRVFRFPRLKRAFEAYTKSQVDAWSYKTAAADQVLAAGRPLIWTDDEIPAEGPLRDRLAAAGALVIAPKPRRGLTRADLAEIEAYARRHVGSAVSR